MITSPHNPKLKQVRRLARRSARERERIFAVEGEDLIGAAQAAGREPMYVLGQGGLEVAPALLADVSQLGSGTRAIGVFEQRWSAPRGPLCLYLHGVRDPGNVGTILRAAEAFGAGSVVLGPGCADPHSPKALRASMGAIFTCALARADAPGDLPGEAIALVAHGGESLRGPLATPATLLLGGERAGLPADVLAACARSCSIAQVGGDSLNVAMAATVALYEATRMAGR